MPNLEAFNLLVILLLALGIMGLPVWFLVDGYLFSRFDGKIKRGIGIWHRELTNSEYQFILKLSENIIEYKKTILSKHVSAFIKIEGQEVLIVSHAHAGKLFIGYCDLSASNRKMKYRMSTPALLFCILLIPTIAGIVLFLFWFVIDTRDIDNFLKRKAMEFQEIT